MPIRTNQGLYGRKRQTTSLIGVVTYTSTIVLHRNRGIMGFETTIRPVMTWSCDSDAIMEGRTRTAAASTCPWFMLHRCLGTILGPVDHAMELIPGIDDRMNECHRCWLMSSRISCAWPPRTARMICSGCRRWARHRYRGAGWTVAVHGTASDATCRMTTVC